MSESNGRANGGLHVGRRMRRKEDPPWLQGRGNYVDDITMPGILWAAFVRSPEAHARIASIDASAARERPGIEAVFTGADLDLEAPLPLAWVPPGVEVTAPEHWPLAKETVKHVGDPVAVVIGHDRYAVIDAAEDVIVEYDPLPVIVDPEAALAGGDLVHPDLGTNKVHEWSLGGDVESALAAAEVVIERRFVNHRTAGAPIEPRGVIADYRTGELTMWSATQVPHFLKLFLALQLGMTEDRVRVIAPDVGGGFGSKLQIYGEEILLAWASRKLGLPIKWIETRSENMATAHHGRDQIAHVTMGADRDGTFKALHVKILADFGAYRWDAVRTDITGVMTNKMGTDAIRGAGRPEATHYIDVTIDQMARELGIDRLELRRKNFIPKEDFPAETAVGMVYDSGDYHGTLAKLLEHFDPETERGRSVDGKLRGVGFATWTEICGLAPSRATGPGSFGVQAGLMESALVRVHVTGAVSVYTGIPEDNLPAGMEPGLEETSFYDPENFVFPFGAHAAVVEIDPETGKVDLVRYLAVDDCGPAINPNLIDGQIHGGIVHAVGQALYERVSYDENGQLETGSFVSYALPSAAELPSFETDRTETPSPVNSLGVKGIGEAGTIAASAAVTNAVIDALEQVGVNFINGSVVVRGESGEHEIAAADLFQDYLTTAVADGEIITEVRLPAGDGWGTGYAKFNRRVEEWAMVAACAAVRKGADGSCEDVRVGLTNMANVPLRASAVEQALRGGGLDQQAIAAAAQHAADGTDPPADLNASADYKRHLARVLCRRALEEAVAAA